MDNIRMNTSAINIQRTLVMQQICRREQLQEEMARHFWPVIGTANQVAYMAIDDAVEAMRERGMLRHNEKRHAQMAVEEYHRYERAAYEHFAATGDDRYTLWQDLIGRAAERLQTDVQRLFFAAKNVLEQEYQNITKRKVSEKKGEDFFRTLGQELAASAWWTEI